MKFSWIKSAWKAIVQIFVLILSAGIVSLAGELAHLDLANNPTLEGWLLVTTFFLLNILRNWLKQVTTFGRYL